MTKIHVISDLFLGFVESSDEDEILPDVDLVILNGNIGHIKRSMLYAETLAKKYPTTHFVVNLGQTELYSAVTKRKNEIQESMLVRKASNDAWPPNLHYSNDESMIFTLRNGQPIDVLCTYGFPNILKVNVPWEQTAWFKDYSMDVGYDLPESHSNAWKKPPGTSDVRHGLFPIWATKEWVNQEHQREYWLAKNWEEKVTCLKILVTHINPYKDSRCEGLQTIPYNIHLDQGLWIGSNKENNGSLMLGAGLYSNPGRGRDKRQKVITVK